MVEEAILQLGVSGVLVFIIARYLDAHNKAIDRLVERIDRLMELLNRR